MRIICALLLAATSTLPISGAYADEPSALAPGKPAGVHQAQAETALAVQIGLAAGLGGLAIAAIASHGKSGGCASGNAHTPCGTTTTTTTTGTAP